MKNPYFVLGLAIMVFSLLGGMPFSTMKTTRVRQAGFVVTLLAMILGFCFVVRGIYIYDLSLRDERRIEQEKVQRARAERDATMKYQADHSRSASVNTNK